MADFDITGFITQSMAGNALAIVSTPSVSSNNIIIDEQPITVLGTSDIDLGKYFTAVQVLESYTLRSGILAGQIRAYPGTITLAKTF
jgi:hypothetical protein